MDKFEIPAYYFDSYSHSLRQCFSKYNKLMKEGDFIHFRHKRKVFIKGGRNPLGWLVVKKVKNQNLLQVYVKVVRDSNNIK